MIKERLALLRGYMKSNGIDACIIPSSDPHQSEYVATHWESREWISGFTGSSGLVIVTESEAGLWTDSRYFIQAEDQLKDTGIELHKVIKRSEPVHLYWLRDNLAKGSRVAIDGTLFSKSQYDRILKILKENDIEVTVSGDLFLSIWKDRPDLPVAKVFSHDIEYAGISRAEKITEVKAEMESNNAEYMLVSTLDDIAWLLNIRGSDIRLNPVVISYLLIGLDKSYLFINKEKLHSEIAAQLESDNVYIKPYSAISQALSQLDDSSTILLSKNTTSVAMYQKVTGIIKHDKKSIISHLKGIKNPTECDNYRRCMVRDGVALTHAFMWLEAELQQRGVPEYEFADVIANCRSKQAHYHDESFDAIVGYKGNGAIVHYRATEEESSTILNQGALLVDSGGQYLDGTTDITRTISLDEPSEDFKQAYTNVLKGMIALTMSRFPDGTTGAQLDVLARQHLWSSGMNYLHGTGHGVGFFLNVHEGPQGFSTGATAQAQTAIQPGMVTSNEPGYYLEDHYGIRIENLILCVESEYEKFYQFETITYFPIEIRSINYEIMTKAEIGWLNDYHATVLDKLSPHLDENAQKWLVEKCRSI